MTIDLPRVLGIVVYRQSIRINKALTMASLRRSRVPLRQSRLLLTCQLELSKKQGLLPHTANQAATRSHQTSLLVLQHHLQTRIKHLHYHPGIRRLGGSP